MERKECFPYRMSKRRGVENVHPCPNLINYVRTISAIVTTHVLYVRMYCAYCECYLDVYSVVL